MNPFVFGIKDPEHGWLEPAVHELIQLAQQEAAQRGAQEVSLEHLLLGTLVQNDVRVMSLFVALGLEPASLRERILGRLGMLHPHEGDLGHVPLAQELQICVDLAIAATHVNGTMLVSVEHLLLCVLSNQWKLLSDKLIERLISSGEWDELIPICGELAHQERRLLFYIQNLVHHLSRFQEATRSFSDLPGLAATKRELQRVITQVAVPVESAMGRREPQEVLLLGTRADIALRLAEAVACELGTRLLTFSFSSLVTMCTPFTTYLEVQHRKDQRISAQDMCFSQYGIALAQSVLQRFFNRVHLMSTCVLLVENLDAGDFSGHTSMNEIRDQLLALLCVEIEQLIEGEQIIILATATAGIDAAFQHLEEKKLWHARHFEHRLVIDDDASLLAAVSSAVCPGCQHAVALHWKHCIYCGILLAHGCPRCGSLCSSTDGALFCYECGNALD